MYVMVSKSMVKELNKRANKHNIEFRYVEYEENSYKWNVTIDSYNHYNDYNWKTGKFKVICAMYPENYYAMPQYITTCDLEKAFKRASEKTVDSLVNEIIETYTI